MEANKISPAEHEIMRLLWAQGKLTSREIIDQTQRITSWKEGTIKSLLHRLVVKEAVRQLDDQRPYQYEALISTQVQVDDQLESVLKGVCQKQHGQVIAHLIETHPLSHTDCQRLIQLLTEKLATAPDDIPCCCPVGQCQCHLNH